MSRRTARGRLAAVARAAKRFLRSPRVIVGEVTAIVMAGLAMTLVPQAAGQIGLPAESPSFLDRTVAFLGLDRVAQSAWFMALVLFAATSLAIVLVEQWRRLLREWRLPLNERAFDFAPYRREFLREPRRGGGGAEARLSTRGRLGLAGSPLFHLGLMGVVVAGLVRLFFGVDARVDLVEGEVLPPSPAAYGAQWPGPLARPFCLVSPLRFDRLTPEHYASGELRALAAEATIEEPNGDRRVVLAVNAPFQLGAERLYLTSLHGPAAMVDLVSRYGPDRRAILMRAVGQSWEGVAGFKRGFEVRLRGAGIALPSVLEVRVLRDGVLAGLGTLAGGQSLLLPTGERLHLHDIRYWAQLAGARDYSTWIAYGAFGLSTLGAVLMFTVVKVDTAVLVTPAEGGERVLVALRAHRFAPLFADRFEELVRRESGPPAVG